VKRRSIDADVHWWLFAWLAACLLLIYLPDVGRGFIKDDFGWVLHSPLNSFRDMWRLVTDPPGGFYRPLVALSFGADHRLFGLAPMAYAVTNLCVVIGIAIAIKLLTESLGLEPLAATLAAGLWSLNFHGVGGALLWISGRTSLLTTLFAVGAATAFVRKRSLLAGILVLCALGAKEEPIFVPAIFAAWAWIDRPPGGSSASQSTFSQMLSRVWPSLAALAVYFALRWQSHAFTPADAPSAYRLSVSPGVLVANALQYADRSLTFVAAIGLLGAVAFSRRVPALDDLERRNIYKGLTWLILGFGVTIAIPTRSSLYVCFPAVGSALIGACVIRAISRGVPPRRRPLAAMTLIVLPVILLPVYWSRNSRLKEEALLSTRALATINAALADGKQVESVLIYERPDARPSMTSAFGGLLPDAIALTAGRTLTAQITSDAELPAAAVSDPRRLHFLLENGDLVQVGTPH
jgi:hypothetical protein